MSNETVTGIVIDSTETPVKEKKFRRPSKKTLIAIGATAATLATAAVVIVKSNSKDDETDTSDEVLIDYSTTETLTDLENPTQS